MRSCGCLNYTCASLHRLPHSFLILMACRVQVSEGAILVHDTAADNIQCPTPICGPCPIFAPQPLPQTVHSTALRHAPVRNPLPFVHKTAALDCDRTVVPAGRTVGERSRYCTSFDAEAWRGAWKCDLSPDAGIDVGDDEAGARKLVPFLVQHQDLLESASRDTQQQANMQARPNSFKFWALFSVCPFQPIFCYFRLTRPQV